jgi:hypothetical protein
MRAVALSAVPPYEHDEMSYTTFLQSVKDNFVDKVDNGKEPLFTTDVDPAKLWSAYVRSFTKKAERQYHTCNTCRHFIERFAGLVTITERGTIFPAVLSIRTSDRTYQRAFDQMKDIVRGANVTGVFLSQDYTIGAPVTGPWQHLHLTLPDVYVTNSRTQTADQMVAEKLEEFGMVLRALNDYPLPIIRKALGVIKSDKLYRSEKVLGQAEWLFGLQQQISSSRITSRQSNNIIWRNVARAPSGFCHPRSSMIGTLLDDLAGGMAMDQVVQRFTDKMNPTKYQRPTSIPTAQTIAQAESIVAKLKAEGSLQRRTARLDDYPLRKNLRWVPPKRTERSTPVFKEGVFSGLSAKEPKPIRSTPVSLPATTITWERFSRTILPNADLIEYFAKPGRHAFGALTTAVNPKAPPILQWDFEKRRNPMAHYFHRRASSPETWGLKSNSFVQVTGISFAPWMWDDQAALAHQGAFVAFFLKDARDSQAVGLGLFPEILKKEFHSIRKVIEAYCNETPLEGRESGDACGILLSSGQQWYETFRVTAYGQTADYILDRWD